MSDVLSSKEIVASVQCLTVRFRRNQSKQSIQRFRHNIGSAFAFTKNYLFTTHNLLQESDPEFEVDGVWISDPADPLTTLMCKVRVLGSVQELDVAVLECDQVDYAYYDLCRTPTYNPFVIHIAQRGQSLIPEIRRGTAYPRRGPYEGLCCLRPVERCTGAPVFDSRARVMGMLKSGVSFATSDGLMHALKQISMSLDHDKYAEVQRLCSLWEFNKAIVDEERKVGASLPKRLAEGQGGRATKKAKNSTLPGEEHEMSRVHDHGMKDVASPVNDLMLESVEVVHVWPTERPSISDHEPTALQNKHRLDENKPAYPPQSPLACRSPMVIRSEQSLENTVGYTYCNLNQSLLNSSLNNCRDSPGSENNKQYLTNREASVNSRLDNIYSSSSYARGERSLEGENWIWNPNFDFQPALRISPGLHLSNLPRAQRQLLECHNTDFLYNYYPNLGRTPSSWNPPSVHKQRLESGVGDLSRRYGPNPPQQPQQQFLEGGNGGLNRNFPRAPGFGLGLKEAKNQAWFRFMPPLRPLISAPYNGMNGPSLYQQ